MNKFLIGIFSTFIAAGLSTAIYLALGGDWRQTSRHLYYSVYLGWADDLVARAREFNVPEITSQEPSDRPNIIVVLTDDQYFSTLQYMPLFAARMEQEGIRFTNAVTTNPECCPARSSILSGGWPTSDTGVLTNGMPNGSIHNFNEGTTLATLLQTSGYRTGFIGKYMHGYVPGYVPPGWSYFTANNDGGMIRDYFNLFRITRGSSGHSPTQGSVSNWLLPRRQYITNFQFEEAIQIIRHGDEQPLFVLLSIYAPHVPLQVEYASDWPAPGTVGFDCFDEFSDVSKRPLWIEVSAELVSKGQDCGASAFRGQVALLQSVDRNMELLFEEISQNLHRQTIVIFTSDNGLELGRSYIYHDKGTPYEGAVRVPLVMFGGNVSPAETNALVAANLDVPATVLELAQVPGFTDGLSLLSHNSISEDRVVLLENYGYLEYKNISQGANFPVMVWSAVRTQTEKLIEYADGHLEYFDISIDPNETQNLIDDSDRAERVAELYEVLVQRRALAITSDLQHELIAGVPLEIALSHWGSGRVTWRIASGGLPDGLTLDSSTGVIRGVPAFPGQWLVDILAETTVLAQHANRPQRHERRFVFNVR